MSGLAGWPWQKYFDKITSCKVKLNDFTTAENMFFYLNNMETIDLSELDTSNVTDLSCMFSECDSLQSVDLSKFDTANVESMVELFNSCTSLKKN